MAKKQAKNQSQSAEHRAWQARVDDALRRHGPFVRQGEQVVRRYRLESENQPKYYYDKYNILYSSTETIKPSLYASTPKIMVTKRHRDRENMHVTLATMLLETAVQYAMEEIDFDSVIEDVVEDYLLPGMGVAWVRYEAVFSTTPGEKEGEEYEELDFEGLALDYVHYKDFLTSDGRSWVDKWWIGRRVYLNKEKATERFGEEKANHLNYCHTSDNDTDKKSKSNDDPIGTQAIVYEIWDKNARKAIWFSPDYTLGLLDERPDPYNLKDFWPTPRPIRAITTTSEFMPRALYSQYQAQAETLDEITQKIRVLTKALRVIGVFDGSMDGLDRLLTGVDNKMIPVNNWAQFAGNGGMNGSVSWVPIKDVANVLAELYKQREIAKNEIYEITGFSDIVRGVSKASETLGAQEIKNQWAGGRLRKLQKEVQRYCRDLIRIFAEIISEKFDDTSLALYAGFEPPPITPEEQQLAAQHAAAMLQHQQGQQNGIITQPPPPPPPTQRQQALDTFKKVIELIRNEKQRCALVGIETDSTIMPDEAQERKDRMEFLGQIGAYLQQAGPMAMQYPDMRGLLGAIMMFVVRTFRSSRPIEKEFEDFQKAFAAQGQQQPPGEEKGDDGKAKAEAAVQTAQLKAQADSQNTQTKVQAEQAAQAQDLQFERWKVEQQEATKRQKQQQDHDYRMAQLALERDKLNQKAAVDGHSMEMDEEQLERDTRQQLIDRAAKED